MAYPTDLVARIKGALRVLRPKQLAAITGIPVDTIKDWNVDERRGHIEADQRVADNIRDAILGTFNGVESET